MVGAHGYRAAYAPIRAGDAIAPSAYAQAAGEAGIVIAEVGAWGNKPLSTDPAEAEEFGARCRVNVAGSRGSRWAGPDATNFADDTFAPTVDTVRAIIRGIAAELAVSLDGGPDV